MNGASFNELWLMVFLQKTAGAVNSKNIFEDKKKQRIVLTTLKDYFSKE